MFNGIYHIGLTVMDIERSLKFYRDILGLHYQGEILMEGKETENIFQKNCKAKVAYLTSSNKLKSPSIELIQFINIETKKEHPDFFTTSISELCFYTNDIDEVYQKLLNQKVECLSNPQEFNFSKYGFGKSKAFYFKDPDGIILEVMQLLEN